jgi:hypothetical protein
MPVDRRAADRLDTIEQPVAAVIAG